MKEEPIKRGIPLWIKIFGWMMAVLGLAYALAMYFSPNNVFTGIDASQNAQRFFVFGMAARNLAIAVGFILAIQSNRLESMTLVLIISFIAEIQVLFISVNTKGFLIGEIAFIGAVLIIEVLAIISLLKQIKASKAI